VTEFTVMSFKTHGNEGGNSSYYAAGPSHSRTYRAAMRVQQTTATEVLEPIHVGHLPQMLRMRLSATAV
jgi:hypothetical protein